MTTKRGLSYIGDLTKKHLDVYGKQVIHRFAVITIVLVLAVAILALVL